VSDIPGRIFRISKSYLNKVRDRVDDALSAAEAAQAEEELKGPADTPVPGSSSGAKRPADPPTYNRDDTSPEAMYRRAEERIRRARADLESREDLARSTRRDDPAPAASGSSVGVPAAGTLPAPSGDPNLLDFRVMGVAQSADWDDIQAAYENLTTRCDPRRFPDGSFEQREAQRILARINESYERLRNRFDPTESRFAKLEFDAPPTGPGDAAATPPPPVPPEIH
jgi:hypothetical protein